MLKNVRIQGLDWNNLASREPPELKPYIPASSGEPAFYSDLSDVCNNSDDVLPKEFEPGYEAALTRMMGFSKKNFSEFSFDRNEDDNRVSGKVN